MTKPVPPLAFTRSLVEHLSQVRATEKTIEEAKTFVRARRDLRNEPSDRKGYEYVVERLLRPTITKCAENALRIIRSDSHRRIYSSHFHTTSDEPSDWRSRWQDFKRAHQDVDTDDDGHSRRADLFISMGKAGPCVNRVQVSSRQVQPSGTGMCQPDPATSHEAPRLCLGPIRRHPCVSGVGEHCS